MSDRPNLYLISRKLQATTVGLAMLGTTYQDAALKGAIAHVIRLIQQAKTEIDLIDQLQKEDPK